MADAEIEARLKSHSKAFESLMSLIPAKLYYGEDNSDQWQRKKQTKEQKRAAKKAKLDPASNKSALDVQNERKRKREEEGAGSSAPITDKQVNESSRGRKDSNDPTKKRKANDGAAVKGSAAQDDGPVSDTEAARRQAIVDKKKAKRDRKKDARAKEREKKDARKEVKKTAKLSQHEIGGQVNNETEQMKQGSTAGELKNKVKHARRKAQPNYKSESKNRVTIPSENDDEDEISDEDATEIDESRLLALNSMDPGEGIANEVNGIDGDLEIMDKSVDTEDEEEAEEEDDSNDDEDAEEVEENDEANIDIAQVNDEMAPLELNGLADDDAASSESSESNDESPTFDGNHDSSTSSISSIQPERIEVSKSSVHAPTTSDQLLPEDTETTSEPRQKPPKLPQIDPVVLQERLQARLAVLRAARKADGVDGKPARNRQELIEGRRRKEETRKAHKKDLRAKARQEERDAETEAARLRGGSGSPFNPGTFSPRGEENSFSFGRVAFDDGTTMDAGLTSVLPAHKKKGAQDVKTALEAAQKKQARINGLDAEKRADIEEKDRWLTAKKRINGERVRDDTSLLKKTLKRKEKEKAKSEKDWDQRIDGVQKGKEMRQKKREDNIRKRREEKGGGKKKGKPAVKRRPGFEGTFKSGGGRKP